MARARAGRAEAAQATSGCHVIDPTTTRGVSNREQIIERLFQTQHATLVGLAVLLGADDPEACVSEAFYSICWRRGGLRNADAAPAYLRRVVCCQAASQIKRRQRERTLHDKIRSDPTITLSAKIDREPHDDHQAVIDALGKLPRRQREVLVLQFWDHRPDKQIAAILKIKPETVRTHAFRGRASLKGILENTRGTSTLEKLT
jgi:RNA polymerase sigma factor (sigma-70 family)